MSNALAMIASVASLALGVSEASMARTKQISAIISPI